MDPDAQPSPRRSDFDAAASRLFAALRAGAPGETPPHDLEVVGNWLRRWLRLSFRSLHLPESEADEEGQEILLRMFELDSTRLTEIRNPAAYLTQLARNRTIDKMRRRASRHVELSDDLVAILASHDDEIATMLEATVTTAQIRAAMRAASQAGDDVALRVVSTWLDIADELGDPPTSRDVAARSNVSHTTVNQALKRFKSYFPPA